MANRDHDCNPTDETRIGPRGLRKVVVRVVVACSVVEAFDQWISVVWIGGGSLGRPVIKDRGNLVTGEGCIRVVGGGVTEKILVSEIPSKIIYTVCAGPFPVQYHRGYVRFQPTSPAETEIAWECDFTPSFVGRVLGVGLDAIIRFSFRRMLSALVSHVANRSGT